MQDESNKVHLIETEVDTFAGHLHRIAFVRAAESRAGRPTDADERRWTPSASVGLGTAIGKSMQKKKLHQLIFGLRNGGMTSNRRAPSGTPRNGTPRSTAEEELRSKRRPAAMGLFAPVVTGAKAVLGEKELNKLKKKELKKIKKVALEVNIYKNDGSFVE